MHDRKLSNPKAATILYSTTNYFKLEVKRDLGSETHAHSLKHVWTFGAQHGEDEELKNTVHRPSRAKSYCFEVLSHST